MLLTNSDHRRKEKETLTLFLKPQYNVNILNLQTTKLEINEFYF